MKRLRRQNSFLVCVCQVSGSGPVASQNQAALKFQASSSIEVSISVFIKTLLI